MAKRLLPFRQYDEKDVINEFFIAPYDWDTIKNPFLHGDNDDGVLVYPYETTWGPYNLRWTNGSSAPGWEAKVHSSPIGRTGFFVSNFMYATRGSGGPAPMGMTLKQTLQYDENGEPLLGRDTKLTELGAVLPYKPVPVVSAGIFTINESSMDTAFGELPSVGDYLTWGNLLSGKFKKWPGVSTRGYNDPIAVVLAEGERPANDAFPGKYYVIKLDVSMRLKKWN
jgi:hypothetical protein